MRTRAKRTFARTYRSYYSSKASFCLYSLSILSSPCQPARMTCHHCQEEFDSQNISICNECFRRWCSACPTHHPASEFAVRPKKPELQLQSVPPIVKPFFECPICEKNCFCFDYEEDPADLVPLVQITGTASSLRCLIRLIAWMPRRREIWWSWWGCYGGGRSEEQKATFIRSRYQLGRRRAQVPSSSFECATKYVNLGNSAVHKKAKLRFSKQQHRWRHRS